MMHPFAASRLCGTRAEATSERGARQAQRHHPVLRRRIVVVGVHRAHRRLRRQVVSDDARFAGVGWTAGNTQDGSKMLSVGVELAKGRRPGAGELKA